LNAEAICAGRSAKAVCSELRDRYRHGTLGRVILDGQEQFIVSVSWVQRGGLVRRDIVTGELSHFDSDGSDYMRLYAIDGHRFMTAGLDHEQETLRLSVRRFDAPGSVLWSLTFTPNNQAFTGDLAATVGIQRFHLASFKVGGSWGHHLITVNSDGTNATLGALPWYNEHTYDQGYQGLIDVVSIPGSDFVLVSVARSSTIVVHDPSEGREVARFDLAGRGGNPMLRVVGSELWTVDYDTFVRVDLGTRRVIKSVKVQPPPPPSTPPLRRDITQVFAGDLFVWAACQKAVIPRPFSGDVVVVDPKQCVIESSLSLKGQPLLCVVTKTGHVIARDWKTGDWSEGTLQNT
jgi:hypothetical protein